MSRTPLMKQYSAIKSEHQGSILFFRMGDFFEMFFEDAKIASKVLGLTLTSRNHSEADRVPLAGFPHHQLEGYLAKMLKAGYNVSICEQVEDPKKAKGLVKREVIEVVTPGSSLSENVLEDNRNNYLASVVLEKDMIGAAYADISTGEFAASEGSLEEMGELLEHISPAEILYPHNLTETFQKDIGINAKTVVSKLDDWFFSYAYTEDLLKRHFGVVSLRGLGLDNSPLAVRAAGAILAYLKEELKRDCSQLRRITLAPLRSGMTLDPATIRNLELFNSFSGRTDATLYHIINRTSTPMGSRLLRRWLGKPLTDPDAVNQRLDFVQELVESRNLRNDLQPLLKKLCDIERTLSRLAGGRGNPRDALALSKSLELIPQIIDVLNGPNSTLMKNLGARLDPVSELANRLQTALADDPPFSVSEGGIFRGGYNQRLDNLRSIAGSGKDWIINRQEEERSRTGIHTLKIGYNKVFGYYIEVTKPHIDKVPSEYIRKQTLVNAERYITPELKEYEEKVLRAEEEIKEIEYELFGELRYTIAGFAEVLQADASIIAEIDVYLCFAETAIANDYCRPQVVDEDIIEIKDSRHPVIEKLMPPRQNFIPNNLTIGGNLRIIIITGPNMAGKSTYLRQAALIVLMAQAGCFVPAKEAKIGVVDRIFTRVGAQDNLVEGESTFLLEMNEAANILNHATPKSLIVLDEIGRGTSTFDGLSIAWALTEYLHNNPGLRSKTLFATHYHELTELGERLPGVKNFNILVREHENHIIFLRKIAPGGCDRSYGIQVARMAGLPHKLIDKALEVLARLEGTGINHSLRAHPHSGGQLSLFTSAKDNLREKLGEIDPNNLTPRQALDLLYELRKFI